MKRIGKCEPDKCGAACCKAFLQKEEMVGDEKFTFPDGVCEKLKNNRCSIYSNRPQGCKDFPQSPDHPHYQAVKDVCTYKFIED